MITKLLKNLVTPVSFIGAVFFHMLARELNLMDILKRVALIQNQFQRKLYVVLKELIGE